MDTTRGDDQHPQGGAYAWYVVFVLILAYTVSFIDRQILTLMVEPIRASLKITDLQMSLLHGLAFALFYSLLGLPIGRLVDRRRRTMVIAVGIVVWSAMTALCGAARNFTQLFLARIGVGVGEAALSPGAYSLLADTFPPHRLSLAMSFYLSAAYVGAGIATMAGGALIAMVPPMTLPVLGALEPWQGVFLIVALPGLVVAAMVALLREPPRTGAVSARHPDFAEVFAHVGRNRAAYMPLMLGYALSGMIWWGASAWLPTFFMRVFGWTAAEVGWRFGLVMMLGGTLGAVSGGSIATWLRARGHRDANIRIGLVALALAAPSGIAATLSGSGSAALFLLLPFLFGCSMPFGSAAAAVQEITPNEMRGQVSAIYLFCLNAIGMAIGPLLVASFTDLLFTDDAAVGKSLALSIALVAPLAALLLWRGCAPYRLLVTTA